MTAVGSSGRASSRHTARCAPAPTGCRGSSRRDRRWPRAGAGSSADRHFPGRACGGRRRRPSATGTAGATACPARPRYFRERRRCRSTIASISPTKTSAALPRAARSIGVERGQRFVAHRYQQLGRQHEADRGRPGILRLRAVHQRRAQAQHVAIGTQPARCFDLAELGLCSAGSARSLPRRPRSPPASGFSRSTQTTSRGSARSARPRRDRAGLPGAGM